MWLRYGVDNDKALISIDDVPSGKSDLACPYCNGSLTAKKGLRVGHHFAHTHETCREVDRDGRELPHLPLYDSFNINLTPKEFKLLKDLWERYGIKDLGIYKNEVSKVLVQERLLEFNPFRN